MKERSLNILLVGIMLLTLLAIMMVFFLYRADLKFENNITVTENGVTESVMKVKDLTLTPGAQRDYHVNLICDATGGYHFFIDYEEVYDGGMKDFVNVRIMFGEQEVYYGRLKTLLDEGEIPTFDGILDHADPLVLSFYYEMPIETGNEAQGTCADFDIIITIKKN